MLINSLKKSLVISGLTTLLGIQGAEASAPFQDCSDWSPCCFEYGLNPPPTCPTACGCTFYGDIEFLYWKPFVGNCHAADLITADRVQITPTGNTNANHNNNYTSEHKDYKFEWDSGFRVGIGYGIPCDKWGFAFTWTHYRTDTTFTETGSGGTYDTSLGSTGGIFDVRIPIPGFLSGGLTAGLVTHKSAELFSKWNFEFNQIDLDFFRDFYVGCSLSLKPYIGLRALVLKNSIHSMATYTGKALTESFYSLFNSESIFTQKLQSDFKSFGLKGGLESFWEAACGLGLFGNFGISILYSHYETDHKLNNRTEQIGSSIFKQNFNVDLPYSFNSLKTMTDLSFGVQWRKTINCNQNLVVIKAGWEHHMILQGSQFQSINRDYPLEEGSYTFAAASSPRGTLAAGDISLYGFVVSASFSF